MLICTIVLYSINYVRTLCVYEEISSLSPPSFSRRHPYIEHKLHLSMETYPHVSIGSQQPYEQLKQDFGLLTGLFSVSVHTLSRRFCSLDDPQRTPLLSHGIDASEILMPKTIAHISLVLYTCNIFRIGKLEVKCSSSPLLWCKISIHEVSIALTATSCLHYLQKCSIYSFSSSAFLSAAIRP